MTLSRGAERDLLHHATASQLRHMSGLENEIGWWFVTGLQAGNGDGSRLWTPIGWIPALRKIAMRQLVLKLVDSQGQHLKNVRWRIDKLQDSSTNPFTNWNSAKKTWKMYENVFQPLKVERLDNWDWEAFQIHRSWIKFQLPLSAPNVHLLIDSRILFPNCWVSIVRKNQQLRCPKNLHELQILRSRAVFKKNCKKYVGS